MKSEFTNSLEIETNSIAHNNMNKKLLAIEDFKNKRLDNQLSLRKQKMIQKFMRLRKEENNFSNKSSSNNQSKFLINLQEIEKNIKKETLSVYLNTPPQNKNSVLETFLYNEGNQYELRQFAIIQLKKFSFTLETLPPNSLIIAAIKCFCDNYPNNELKLKIQKELLYVFINWASILKEFNEYLYEDLFIANILSIFTSKEYDISFKLDSIWYINNLIINQETFSYFTSKIDLIKIVENIFLHITEDYDYYPLLNCMINIMTQSLNDNTNLYFLGIFENIISVFLVQYSKYETINPSQNIQRPNNQGEQHNYDQLKILYKNIKYIIRIFILSSKKDNEYIAILLRHSKFISTIYDILIKFNPSEFMNSDKVDLKISNNIKLKADKVKTKYIIYSNENFFSSITDLLGFLFYAASGDEFESLIKKQTLVISYSSILEQALLHNIILKPETLYLISLLFSNYTSEGIKYAKPFFLNSSIPKYLFEFTKFVLDEKFKIEYLTLLYNCFLMNDKEINQHIIYGLDFIDILCDWLLNTKNTSFISLLLDFMNIIFQYNEMTGKILDNKTIKKKIEVKGVFELLQKLNEYKRGEITELADHLLCYWDLEEIIDIKVDFNGENEEYEDILE